MKKISLLLLVGLLLTMQSCFLIDHYEDIDVFTTYYMGDRCIIALGGTSIVEKSFYEYHKKKCDRAEFFIIYQEDILKDTVDELSSERYMDFIANKTNFQRYGRATSGLSTNEKKTNGKYTCTAEILPDIKLQKVDSIIIDIFYTMN